MATIVRDNLNDKFYVLIGTGFGIAKSSRPGAFVPEATTSSSTESGMLAVANSDGDILWLPSFMLSVISVDGKPCRELLAKARKDDEE